MGEPSLTNSPQESMSTRAHECAPECTYVSSTSFLLSVCVCVYMSADFDSKQKSAENFISAPLFVMLSSALLCCVCVYVCVLLLHFATEKRQQRIANVFGTLKRCGSPSAS